MKWFVLLGPCLLFGAYIGNPADPAIMNTGFFSESYPFFKFTSGYIYDYTSNKRYEQTDDPNFDPIKKFGLHSQLASFSLIFIERLQLFGTAGGSKEIIEEQPITDLIFSAKTDYHFSWSAGGKVILLQWGKTYLSTDFTYFEIPPSHQSFFKYLNQMNLSFLTEKQKISLSEWQLSAALSSRFFFITPYGGVNYLNSKLHLQAGNEVPSVNYRNEAKWGYFYGLTLSVTGRFHLNFERRLRDEFAYSFATIGVF